MKGTRGMPGINHSTTLYLKALAKKLEQCAETNHGCHQCPVLEQCLKLQKTLSDVCHDCSLRRDEYVRLTYWFYELTSLARERDYPAEE